MQRTVDIPKATEAYTKAREVFRLISDDLAAVEAELERELKSEVEVIAQVGHYLLEAGGKRVRPALLLLAARAANPVQLKPSAVRLGAVIELIHTATLVHDDIIDGANIRRGRPSVNAQWGNDVTVLVGDWLYMMAFQKTLTERNFEILDILTNLTRLMTEGELIQLSLRGQVGITQEQHLDIVRRKTAYLFSAAAEVGAILGGASAKEQQALADYGLNIGIAFQLVDDLLDFTSNEDKLGKPVASDLRDGKLTLPTIWLMQQGSESEREVVRAVVRDGSFKTAPAADLLAALRRHDLLAQAHARAKQFAERAVAAVSLLPDNLYRRALTQIASFVVDREF